MGYSGALDCSLVTVRKSKIGSKRVYFFKRRASGSGSTVGQNSQKPKRESTQRREINPSVNFLVG